MKIGRCRRALGLAGWVLLATACSDAGPEISLEIAAPASTELTTGDFLTLNATPTGTVPSITWATSNERTAAVAGGTVEARRPGTVTITASAEGALSATLELTVVQRPGGYIADEVDYFTEIAFGAEFGTSSPLLRRWRAGSGPLIRVNGSPSSGDRMVLDSVIAEINRLAPVDIEIVSNFPTAEIHFVPQSEFTTILPEAPPGNIGLVWLWWGVDQYLIRSVVLISSEEDESSRAHVIREEVTQMLGLLQDSFAFPESIFYQPFSTVTEYLPIDRVVIELLYRPELSVGMGVPESAQVARTLLRVSPRLSSASALQGAASRSRRGRTTSAAWTGPPQPAWWTVAASGGSGTPRR